MTDVCTQCDWSSNGSFIIIGYQRGQLKLYQQEMQELFVFQTIFYSKEINLIKIAPDNVNLLVASNEESNIEILFIKDNKINKRGILSYEIEGYPKFIDWSQDSDYICINSSKFELKFCCIKTLKQVKISFVQQIKWVNQTCAIG